ncbi:NFXL1 [Bugula neritina]|uniref:NFXL1 n=1 Tax=Bugula neritina TaxID=10212 RepID=A0A7J7J9P2_BUGNE|nr:NFXL1 [Bugula neritina]
MSYIRGKGRGRGDSASTKNPFFNSPGNHRTPVSTEERFRQISQLHSQAVDKHLRNQRESTETFSDNHVTEDDADEELIKKVTASYDKQSCPSSNGDSELNTSSMLDLMMNEDSNVCLVCLESIKRTEKIWSCSSCHCIIHLNCIQQWINEGAYQQQQSMLSEQHFPNKKVPWNCFFITIILYCPPFLCRAEFEHSDYPSLYKCFCGKNTNPTDDPWLLPHSCGETCNKQLKPACGHQCLLLCHPGPCPPCPKSVKVSCYCGQSNPVSRRCGFKAWSCGQPCGKLLECQAHRCQQICHKGECSPCAETSVQHCRCGKEKQSRPCAQLTWSCNQVCGKLFPCGKHWCQETCHPQGTCGECPRSQAIRLCPCGKTSTHNLPCTEDVPCCGDTCGKALSCGQHQCTEKCHYGSCSQCLQFSVKSCRCGARQKEMPCVKTFTCEVRCQKKKSCGRHVCKRRCCDGVACSTCDQICGKKLKCGNHKCMSVCHDGPCYPCTITIDKACSCGQTVVSVPCIRQKVAQPPKCRRPCLHKSKCDHQTIQKHACHFGDCPPCILVCGRKLTGCDHSCQSRCHDSVSVKIQTEKKVLAGPWEQHTPSYTTLIRQPCPPCPFPTSVQCKGQHETSVLPCSNSVIYSCKRECGKELPCTNHTCTLECHVVSGESGGGGESGTECQTCEEACSQPRPKGCTHPCIKPCHPKACPPCKQGVKTRCHCGVTVIYTPCHEWTNPQFNKDEKLSCPGLCPKELNCGHPCSLKCHPPGQCRSKCIEKVTLRCKCRTIKQTVACHLAADKVIECTEKCKQPHQSPPTSSDQGSQSEAPEEKVESVLLPGRRQRKRKERTTSVDESESFISMQLLKKYCPIVFIVLSVLAAFYFAITAEN